MDFLGGSKPQLGVAALSSRDSSSDFSIRVLPRIRFPFDRTGNPAPRNSMLAPFSLGSRNHATHVHPVKTNRPLAKYLLAAALAVLLVTHLGAQTAQVQTNILQYGWNLIAFQTLPTNPSPAVVFGTNMFRAVWTYDNALGLWTQFGRPATGHPEQTNIMPMANIELGRAYWAFYDAGFNTNWVLSGQLPGSAFSLNFNQGWNLVGVPAAGATDINVVSIFKPGDLSKIQLIARWEAANQRYQIYDPAKPESSDFQSLNPNLGHWVKATSQLSIQPDMVVEAEGDVDLAPVTFPPLTNGMAWTPGPEDTSITLPGAPPVFHDRTAQTVIIIPKGRDILLLPLYNRGGGIMLWNVTLLAGSNHGGAATLDASQVSQVLSLAESHGVTSSETDTLKISVDRTHLSPGTFLARLQVSASTGQQKTFDLVIQVGGLDGQWEGSASIQTVNGKANAIPDIDLFLHLFQDNKSGSHQLRGLIDSQETLLWPMDAQLLGHLTDTPSGSFDPNYASRFVISGGYTLPPGDVNHHPFENFPTPDLLTTVTNTDNDTGLPYRTNPEGDRWYYSLPGRFAAPDFLNPFPCFISREVELIGQITGAEGGAAVATGDYYESINGMTLQSIQMRGTFRLVRKAYTPLEKRPYTYFASLPLNGYQVGANAATTNTIQIPDHLLISRILVVVAQDAAVDKHTLQLTGPSGAAITLHGGEALGPNKSIIFDSGDLPIDPLTLLDPPELRGAKPLPIATNNVLDVTLYESRLRDSLASYAVRHPRQSLQTFTDTDAFGTWKLSYANQDSGATHSLLGWSLLVYGAPAYPVAGQLVVADSTDPNRFQDVSVHTLGLNADLDTAFTTIDRITGRFSISCLPGLRVNLQALKPGYLPATIDGLNTATDPRGYRDGLGGVVVGGVGTTNLVLTLRLPSTNSPPQVLTYQQNVNVVASNGVAPVAGAGAALLAGVPDNDIAWDLEWLGVASPPVAWSATGLRAPVINLNIPASAFTTTNNFTLAYRTRAYRISTAATLAYGDWVTVTLQNPTPPAGVSPYWNTVLVQSTVLQGFGAVSGTVPDGRDPTGFTALHAQKTDPAKVDVDRPPLINPNTNPSLDFRSDGLTNALDASDDAEDTDLFPRTFTINAVGSKNNHWAYAEINPISDLRFTALAPPLQGQTPVYDDINKGIDGRDINAPAEPVRLYTALGGRFCNLGVSGSDGIQRVSAGPNPGVDYQPITLAGFLLPNRSFRLGLLGTPNTKYTIQASEDLKSWVPLMSGLAPIDHVDTQAAGKPKRFYRAVANQ